MKRLSLLALALVAGCDKQKPYPPTQRGLEVFLPALLQGEAATQTAPAAEAPAKGQAAAAPAEAAGADGELPSPQYLPVTEKIHALVVEKGETPASADAMKAYTEKVPAAKDATFDMVPLPGGEFTIGSPANEAGRKENEGPQVKVAVDPFWIGKCEMTWDVYRGFMENGKSRNKDGTLDRDSNNKTSEAPEIKEGETLVDVVSQPTPAYVPMHFEMGEGYGAGWPAIVRLGWLMRKR